MKIKNINSRNLINILFLSSIVLIIPFFPSCSQALAFQSEPYAVVKRVEGEKRDFAMNENRHDILFNQARSILSPDEADVYRQGDILIIKLKGLYFPSAVSHLKSDDYALLSKVQRIIQESGKNNVLIEGHTDSKGSDIINQELSRNRARAVKDYLMKHREAHSLDIITTGVGHQSPLATNATPLGRAMNRRVEIMIFSRGGGDNQYDREYQTKGWPLF